MFSKGSHTEVAITVDGGLKHLVLGARAINNRMAVVRIDAPPSNLNVVQVYAPTSAVPDEETEEFYSVLEETLASLLRSEIKLVLVNFKTKVGKTDISNVFYRVVGSHGLKPRNERGNRLLQFCVEQQLMLANTLFQQHNQRLYTWN